MNVSAFQSPSNPVPDEPPEQVGVGHALVLALQQGVPQVVQRTIWRFRGHGMSPKPGLVLSSIGRSLRIDPEKTSEAASRYTRREEPRTEVADGTCVRGASVAK